MQAHPLSGREPEDRARLVLLPGLDGTAHFYAPLLEALPSWIDPLVVTYPAVGPNSYRDLVAVVMRAVGPLERFAVLGWSFGGPLALMVAAERRSSVAGVMLCSSFVTPPNPALVPYRALFTTPLVAAIRAARRIRYLIPGFSTPALRQAKRMTWRQVGSRALAARARAILELDARQLLADCSAPILYIAAARDEVIPRASMNEVLAIAPATAVAEIDGPHLALFTSPEASAACIAAFLQANCCTPAARERAAGRAASCAAAAPAFT